MSLVQELATRGLISQGQVTEILRLANEKYNGSIDEALIDVGVNEDELLSFKGEYFSLPTTTLGKDGVNPEILKLFSKESMEQYKMIPLSIEDGVLSVGILDPENTETTDALQFIASKNGLAFKIFLIRKKDFDKITQQYQGFSTKFQRHLMILIQKDLMLLVLILERLVLRLLI